MELTVNQQNIQKYAERLTNDLCRQFFINKAFISGTEILSFNSDNQLNLLIIKNIFLSWQKEMLKLKSAYFDYEDEEVKKALKLFMNTLSNHIKVYRYDFEPLVQKAVADYILLAAAPHDFFKKEIESLANPKVPTSLIKEFSKYIQVNKFVLSQVVSEIEASGYTETFAGETIRFVLKALNENPDKAEIPETALSGIFGQLPAEVTEFVYVPKPPVTRPAFLDKPKEEELKTEPVAILPIQEEAVIQPTPEVISEVVETEELPVNEFVEEVENVLPEPEAIVEDDVEEVSLTAENEEVEEEIPAFQKPESRPRMDKLAKSEAAELAKDPITLVETLRESEGRSLADTLHVQTKSVPFKTLVPMHYRFTFINSLFGGDQQAWANAVDKIDLTESYTEAVEMLKTEFGNSYNWANDDDNVAMLFSYVERKY